MHDPSEGPSRPEGWFKTARSTATCTCVEVRFLADAVQVRDSKQINAATGDNVSEVITLPTEDWRHFLRQIDDNSPPPSGALMRSTPNDSTVVLHCTTSGIELTYDIEEWRAFQAGVLDGEFDPPSPQRLQ